MVHTSKADCMRAVHKLGKQFPFVHVAISLLVFALLLVGTHRLLKSQSYLAVPHSIHAVEYAPGKFIHGSFLTCTAPSSTGNSCHIMLDGKRLTIRVSHQLPGPANAIRSCEAHLDGRRIDCEKDYTTSSYWARGVTVDSPELQTAMQSIGPLLSRHALLLGAHEGHALLILMAATVGIPLLSVIVIPRLIRHANASLLDLIGKRGSLLMLVPLSCISFFYVAMMIVAFGFAD